MEKAGIGVDIKILEEVIAEWSRKLSEARSLWQEETGTPSLETPNQVRQWLSDNLARIIHDCHRI
jgi:DNA polymerase I-like protein with 3'-5' exonuclease and polymerase domains